MGNSHKFSKSLTKTGFSTRIAAEGLLLKLESDAIPLSEAASSGVLLEKVFLKISQSLQQNTCARVSFLKMLQALACSCIKKETLAQVFSCESCEISGGTRFFLKNTSWRLFLVCERGVILSFNFNTSSAFQTFPRTNCLSPGRSKIDQGVGQQNLLPSLILLVWLRGAKVNGGKFLRIGPTYFESRDA